MTTDQRSVSLSTTTEVEPNDSADTAMAITTGTEIAGELTSGDVDWYAFNAATSDVITLGFNREQESGVTAIVLYGPDGQHLNLRYVGSNTLVELTYVAEQSGTHLVEVVDVEQGDGPYSLTVVTGSADTATPTETPTETPTATATPTTTPNDTMYGEQGYGEYGYGGIGV